MDVLKHQEEVYVLEKLHGLFSVVLLALPQALTHINASLPVSAHILFGSEDLGHFQVHIRKLLLISGEGDTQPVRAYLKGCPLVAGCGIGHIN